MNRIGTVIVTYRPDLGALAQVLHLHAQTTAWHCFIVDNGSSDAGAIEACAAAALDPGRCTVLRQVGNIGLASALNIGISAARAHGCTHVALFDQDTQPEAQTLQQLLEALLKLQAQGAKVAAVGPSHVDLRTGTEYPQRRIRGLSMLTIWPSREAAPAIEVSFVITSGALIPIGVLDVVGPMRDELFIDFVDIEWCFRARATGLRSYCIRNTVIRHTLGDGRRSFFGREVSLHGATRYYYMYRNALLLARLPTIPARFRLIELIYLLGRAPVFFLLSGCSWQHARCILLGLLHGLSGRTGPLQR
jgi:rhamnosyltransferase